MSGNDLKRHAMAQVRSVEAVLRRWDPIGVLMVDGGPEDEYDSYAPHIVSLIRHGGSLAEVVAHLNHLRTESMGLPMDTQADTAVAEEIIRVVASRV